MPGSTLGSQRTTTGAAADHGGGPVGGPVAGGLPARRLERLSSRSSEIELALDAVCDGRGAFVWTAEQGMGASATLELICESVRELRVPRAPVLIRCQPPSAPTRPGACASSVVSQLVQLTGHSVPPELAKALDLDRADYGYLPEVAAVALAEYLLAAAEGATVVLVADDFHRVDELSRSIVVSLVTNRRSPVVLLATAPDDAFPRPLPHPVEMRSVPRLGPADALRLLSVDCRLAVAPHVAARLSALLGGNAAAIAQTARQLTPEQLRGGSLLPDPLPVVPAVRGLLGDRLAHLTDTQRAALLVASVAVVDRTDVLLEAAGLEIDDLLDGPLAEHLALVSGRFSVVDPRVRSLVHGDACLAERTHAHTALARAHAHAGEADLADWHTALATLAGDPALVPALLGLARRLLEHGDVVWAHEVAREAASQGVGADRAEAYALAGVAALQSGHVLDAADWLRKAARSGDDDVRRRLLAPLVCALTFVEGQVPDDVVASQVAPFLVPGSPAPGRLDVVRGVTSAARLHAERGDGTSALQMLDVAAQLVEGEPAGAPDLALARAWVAIFGVGERGEPAAVAGTGTEYEAYAQVCRALAHAADDAHDLAAQTLASAVAGLAPVQPGGRWFDGADAAVTPFVEAHLRLAQVLVHFWAGDLTKAARGLADAAYRLPVGLPLAGLGVALARRLDMAVTGTTGTLATALEETCVCPTARPVRLGLLVDRAIGAAFSHRHTQAATLLELAAERERTDCAHLIHLPGLDDVEAWVLAGRPDAARRALDRRRVESKNLPPATRAAVLARGEIALAGLEELEAYRAAALGARRGSLSPFEHARTELCAGRALSRLGDLEEAQSHLLSAAELFCESGAHAWVTVAQDELAAVDVLLERDGRREPERQIVPGHGEHSGYSGQSGRAGDPGGHVLGEPTDVPGSDLLGAVGDLRGPPRPGRAVAKRSADSDQLAARESDVSDGALADLRARWADELTERELDVALLVVQGGANREVADQLYLSVRTVEVHLGRVFRKLGVRSRVELAVLAHRSGP
ncbi:helix-turn-helix transcriptional regulator [Oerskovia flava]|uniref:helix-turn-helix transcriptional regulator n=1 Tax=Oerskovia flava TaxID=2986422 RepID=UPI0022407030|nr:helix-turn-helix transcriptional regulator [Oerskovia sp. JB1-3-2]